MTVISPNDCPTPFNTWARWPIRAGKGRCLRFL